MGKKRKGDKNERIQRKIRKLQEKIQNNNDEDSSNSDKEVQDSMTLEEDIVFADDNSIYLPPSEWSGNGTPLPTTPRGVSNDHAEPVDNTMGSPQPGPSWAPIPPLPNTEDRNLEENILNLLGDAPKPETNFGSNIHKDVATRWQEILAKGLHKEVKEKLIQEYLIPANCDLMVPPMLNPEAKAALTDTLVKRDFSLLNKQKQLAAALAALSQVTDMLLTNDTVIDKYKLLKFISDASRLLCDGHYIETRTRRSFVISSINSSLKGALIDTNRDKYLFGENLTEKLKAAKSIQRSGDTLKTQQKQQFVRGNSNNKDNKFRYKVNYRALHQRTAGRNDAGQTRSTAPRITTGRMLPPPLPQRRARSPPPPPHQPPFPPPHHRGTYPRR